VSADFSVHRSKPSFLPKVRLWEYEQYQDPAIFKTHIKLRSLLLLFDIPIIIVIVGSGHILQLQEWILSLYEVS
jgi:hypothetical protein